MHDTTVLLGQGSGVRARAVSVASSVAEFEWLPLTLNRPLPARSLIPIGLASEGWLALFGRASDHAMQV